MMLRIKNEKILEGMKYEKDEKTKAKIFDDYMAHRFVDESFRPPKSFLEKDK